MAKRRIRREDLARLRIPESPAVSPDGRYCAFVVRQMDLEKNRYLSHLYLVDLESGALRQLTFGEVKDAHPVWHPDGRTLAFVRAPADDGKAQIYVMRVDGGEARALTDFPEGGITDFRWSPDGRQLGVLFLPKHPDWTKEAMEKRKKEGRSNPPRVIRRVYYRLDGVGFLDSFMHLYLVDGETGRIRQRTRGNFHVQAFDWSPDGRQIAILANRDRLWEERFWAVDIWLLEPEGGKMQKLGTPPGRKMGLAWSPDGRYLAYVGTLDKEDPWSPRNARLWLWDLQQGEARDLCPEVFPAYVGNVTLSDTREAFHGAPPLHWDAKSKNIYTHLSEKGSCYLAVFRREGGYETPVTGSHDVYAVSHAGERTVVALSTATQPGELYLVRDGGYQRLTELHDDFQKEVVLSDPEEVWIRADDGVEIQAWILRPPDLRKGKKYPGLLYIHGGPHAQYGNTFFHEFQYLAAEGWVLLYGNPRGSMGREEEFARAIRGAWGGRDYADVLHLADYLASLPEVDEKRIAIAGGSYGGYMVNWAIGHTDRFACAITDRSVVNLHSFAGTTDFPFIPDGYWKGNAWDSPEHLWKQSPLRYAANIRTPLLIIHSEGDLRCPIGQAEELFAALKRLHREVVFVRYPLETSHGLSRTGPPDLRLDRLQRIRDWLAQWTQGKK